MTKIVTSYKNPDLDGVACSLCIEKIYSGWTAQVAGELDLETIAVLDILDISPPKLSELYDFAEEIWLVDTHHINQLPTGLPLDRVVKITDHHPGGDMEKFPQALIQNEEVGAAATLIAELAIENNAVNSEISQLLQAAIISNTLNFSAPATSKRDHDVFKNLQFTASIKDDVLAAMRNAKNNLTQLPTLKILQSDLKIVDSKVGAVGVCQLEAPKAISLLDRNDLLFAISEIQNEINAKAIIISLSDTDSKEGAIFTQNEALMSVLADNHNVKPDQNHSIRFNRNVQRKSDIFPYLV